MTFDEFAIAYLDLLFDPSSDDFKGRVWDLYGYKPAGVREYLNAHETNPQIVNIIKTRAMAREVSRKRSHSVQSSRYLWQLTTDGGARFLYFQDGPRHFVFVGASYKVKEKKFNSEIQQAERLRSEYLELKEGKVK